MPVQNLTVSYRDPFLMYDGPWFLDDNYARTTGNASLSVSFYGTAIYLQGFALGNYSVSVDDAAPVNYNDYNAGYMFAQDQLTATHHTLTVNVHANLTFESMTVTTGDGDSSFPGLDYRIEDDHPNVTYSGPHSRIDLQTASAGSVTALSSLECAGQCPLVTYANISFHGNEIALYSSLLYIPSSGMYVTYTQQSMYNVSVDGGPPDSWPERSDDIVYNMHSDPAPAYVNSLLYQRSRLPTGDHYVVLTLTSATSAIYFDYAESRAYPQNDQLPIPTTTIGAPTSAPSTARSTNVAAIAGGVVGGVVLAFILSTTMLFVIRRRYRQARLTFVGEDGLDGGGSTQPRRSEEDMPPPLYRRIFPSESGAPGNQAHAEREPPAVAQTPGADRVARKNPRAGASALAQAASRLSTGPANTALDGAPSRAPIARAILDASMWTWKGVRPREQDSTVPVKTNLSPGDTGEK